MKTRATPPFVPFANEADALTIGDLHVENREDRVSIYGSLDLTRDKAGLAHARALKTILDDVVEALQREELPDTIADTPDRDVTNPFTGEA